MEDAPTLEEIRTTADQIRNMIVKTPVTPLSSDTIKPHLPNGASVVAKLELFQQAGSFKARGALVNMLALTPAERTAGVTAVSAGNHALAVSWASAKQGVHAKVVMMEYADPIRVKGCRDLGAEVVLVPDVHSAFAEAERIQSAEGRVMIHPFDGKNTALGTATCGFEFISQVPDLEAVIIPIGGGGLIAGMARAIKLVNPDCKIFGVEPVGAAALHRSLDAGQPVTLDKVETIADSLGAPMSLAYSFGLIRDHVDDLVLIKDRDMLKAGALLYDALNVAVEPACAASTAALLGPLREVCADKRVGVILCGSNISADRAAEFIAKGRADLPF